MLLFNKEGRTGTFNNVYFNTSNVTIQQNAATDLGTQGLFQYI